MSNLNCIHETEARDLLMLADVVCIMRRQSGNNEVTRSGDNEVTRSDDNEVTRSGDNFSWSENLAKPVVVN